MTAKKRIILALCIISGILLQSCSNHSDLSEADGSGVQSRGLGNFHRFSAPEPGEEYTTKAPHNQVYLFAFDNSQLAEKYEASLNAQAHYLRSHSNARILLAGHTDERGSREYNVALGERRANSVRNKLRMAGVSAQQIRVVSYGKERPASHGHDDNAHRQNRRVELIYEVRR